MREELDNEAFWYMPEEFWREAAIEYFALSMIEDELRQGMNEDLQRCKLTTSAESVS